MKSESHAKNMIKRKQEHVFQNYSSSEKLLHFIFSWNKIKCKILVCFKCVFGAYVISTYILWTYPKKKMVKSTQQEQKKNNFVLFLSHFQAKLQHLTKRSMLSVCPIHTKHTFGHDSDMDSGMITKDTFVSCFQWGIDFTDDGTNIRYQGGVTKYCYCRYSIQDNIYSHALCKACNYLR